MNLQVWWSENIDPEFTYKHKENYLEIGLSQFFPIGNSVEGRRLFRAVATKEKLDLAMVFLNDIGKDPLICDVRDEHGVRYGERKIIIEDAEGDKSYEIEDIIDLVKYPKNDTEYDKYFESIEYIDDDGEVRAMTPSGNTASGWASWKERL